MPNIDLMGATYPDVPAVTLPSGATTATFYYPDEIDYASSPSSGGNANRANAILYGTVDSTSTATVFTATVEGLTALVDGTTVMLHNGVVTSASGFTVNVNGLGAKKCYNNMTNATQDTTIFNVAYTMLFVYSTSLDSGNGGWWIYRGYDANTNTIGYQLRTNSTVRNVSDTARYYKLYFTSADGTMWVPASVNSTNNATSARPVNQRPIDPFGPIVYTSASTNYAAGANLAATTIWEQYALVLGYSFNRTGAALTLTAESPVYVKCAPQAAGGVIMDADEPIVQALPSTKDGKVYIYLGLAYDATHIELQIWHPVYWHDGTGIRLWTGAESGGGSTVTVTQTLTSGTEIASVSVDGTATKLYAPTYTLPTASTSTLGGVKVDGSTITITDGVISSSGGGGSVTMEDTAVDAAVEAAWPEYLVSITLTNPMNASEAASPPCKVFNIPTMQSDWHSEDEQLGQVDSTTGSATISVPTSSYGIYVRFYGTYVAVSSDSLVVSGGVSLLDTLERGYIFMVIESGTVTISDVDYDD